MKILQALIDKYKTSQKNSKNKKEFSELLIKSVSDGKISPEEIKEIESKKTEYGFSDKDFEKLKKSLFSLALSAVSEDKVLTKEEDAELLNIQKYLAISDGDILDEKKEIEKLKLITKIKEGNIPPIETNNIILQNKEIAYWVEQVKLIEEKIIDRRYQGGSSGMSFRVMKGVRYHVGGYKGHIITDTGKVTVDQGDLVITNKRVIFRGVSKSFTNNLNKFLDIRFFKDGIQLTEVNKVKPRMFKFEHSGNSEIIAAVISYAINNFGK